MDIRKNSKLFKYISSVCVSLFIEKTLPPHPHTDCQLRRGHFVSSQTFSTTTNVCGFISPDWAPSSGQLCPALPSSGLLTKYNLLMTGRGGNPFSGPAAEGLPY